MSSLVIYQNYIHGKYKSNGTGETFEVNNHATRDVS